MYILFKKLFLVLSHKYLYMCVYVCKYMKKEKVQKLYEKCKCVQKQNNLKDILRACVCVCAIRNYRRV